MADSVTVQKLPWLLTQHLEPFHIHGFLKDITGQQRCLCASADLMNLFQHAIQKQASPVDLLLVLVSLLIY